MLADYEAYAARVGVLEVPAFYSPARQLLINYLYDRAKANSHLVVVGAGLGVVLVGILIWLIRRRRHDRRGPPQGRPLRPSTHSPQE